MLGDGALDGTLFTRTLDLGAGGKVRRLQRGTNVVGVLAVVVGEVHKTVALERAVDGLFGCVGRQHLVVGADAIAGGVWVGERASLEHYLFVLVFPFIKSVGN